MKKVELQKNRCRILRRLATKNNFLTPGSRHKP